MIGRVVSGTARMMRLGPDGEPVGEPIPVKHLEVRGPGLSEQVETETWSGWSARKITVEVTGTLDPSSTAFFDWMFGRAGARDNVDRALMASPVTLVPGTARWGAWLAERLQVDGAYQPGSDRELRCCRAGLAYRGLELAEAWPGVFRVVATPDLEL